MEIHGDSQTSAAVRDPAALSKKSAATDAPFTCVPGEHSRAGQQHRRQERLPSPEQLHLRKQLCFWWTNLAWAAGPKMTDNSQDFYRLTCCLCAFVQQRPHSSQIQPSPNIQQSIHGSRLLCRARLGKEVMLPNHKELVYSPAFMWRGEKVILHSDTRLHYCK